MDPLKDNAEERIASYQKQAAIYNRKAEDAETKGKDGSVFRRQSKNFLETATRLEVEMGLVPVTMSVI